ncbi:MAG: hypothetical protein ACFFC7_35230, partial [Candidatus Hermodarchaeota archaeon]
FKLLLLIGPLWLSLVGISFPDELFTVFNLVFLWFCIILALIFPIILFYVGVKIAAGRAPLNESSSGMNNSN